MRRSLVIGATLVAIAFLLIGGPSLLLSTSTDDVAPKPTPSPEIVTPDGSESGYWPYLSAREAHDKRSPLNLVVRGDPGEIVRLMTDVADGDWEETDHDHFEEDGFTDPIDPAADPDEVNGTLESIATEIGWSQAAGTTRYAYLDPGPDGDTYWATEDLQLQDGDYYGQRYHIRLYESPNPDDQWVVMQAHTEHFDWFTLRHRVDGVEAAQSRAERDLMSIPVVGEREDVTRINLGNSGPSDSDGWATKVDLTAAAAGSLVVALAARGRVRERAQEGADRYLTETDRRRLDAAADRVEAEHLLLVGTILAIFLGVRIVGIALEHYADFLTMHQIAGLLYPVIAVGIPVATYLLASRLERRLDAAVVASTSLAVAIWIDYGLLGVERLPLDVVLQRILLVVAIGLIAAGAARRGARKRRLNGLLVAGLLAWSLLLVGTLFGYL